MGSHRAVLQRPACMRSLERQVWGASGCESMLVQRWVRSWMVLVVVAILPLDPADAKRSVTRPSLWARASAPPRALSLILRTALRRPARATNTERPNSRALRSPRAVLVTWVDGQDVKYSVAAQLQEETRELNGDRDVVAVHVEVAQRGPSPAGLSFNSDISSFCSGERESHAGGQPTIP